MGIILIDLKAWDKILERLIQFTRLLNERLGDGDDDDKPFGWLDNTDVCEILGVGKRTLQNYRGRGLLPYAQINHKCYYKQEDVKAFLENHLSKSSKSNK